MAREYTPQEKEFLDHAKEQYDHWLSVLKLYGVLPNGKPPEVELKPGYTFIDFIEDILSDGKPRLTQELREEYIQKTGNKIELKNFSSKLGMRRERTGRINNVGYKELPLDRRFWWGLSAWFEDNGKDFKPVYKRKIPEFKFKGTKN